MFLSLILVSNIGFARQLTFVNMMQKAKIELSAYPENKDDLQKYIPGLDGTIIDPMHLKKFELKNIPSDITYDSNLLFFGSLINEDDSLQFQFTVFTAYSAEASNGYITPNINLIENASSHYIRYCYGEKEKERGGLSGESIGFIYEPTPVDYHNNI